MLEYCKFRGMGFLAYSPLMDGHLARTLGTETARTKSIAGTPFEKQRRDSDKESMKRVEELAKTKGWAMCQVALAWVAAKATSPIIGANSVRSHNGLQRKQSPLTTGAHMQPERLMESIISGKTLNQDEVKSLEEP